MISLIVAVTMVTAPISEADANTHLVRLSCPEQGSGSKDGELGTAVRIDETHAITDYHVVAEGRCRDNYGRGIRIVYKQPNIDFAIIELRQPGFAWRWGFDCTPWKRGQTYTMGGYASQAITWARATARSLYSNPKAPQHGTLATTGDLLQVGMSGGPAYVEGGKLAALNAAYLNGGDNRTSLLRLLADTPICDPTSLWYRG